jgi:hypothetical protein
MPKKKMAAKKPMMNDGDADNKKKPMKGKKKGRPY